MGTHEETQRPPRRRASRHWVELAMSVALLLAILVVVQVVVERRGLRFDLTPSRRLSLSETTLGVLGEIEDDLHIEAYYARWQRQPVEDLLRRVALASPRVHYEIFDIDRHPERARAAGIAQADRALVTYRGARSTVSTTSEEYLAGGIVRVLRGKARKVYFLRGHGERDVGDPGAPDNYSMVVDALQRENAVARPLDLTMAGVVPADADAVVIAGPQGDLLPGEAGALDAYLGRGGALLVLLDAGPLPQMQMFLAGHDIELGDDLIVDRTNRIMGAEALVVKVPYYRMHPVTAPSDVPSVFVGARTVDTSTPAGAVQTVARTVETAWATPDVEAARRGEASYQEGRDRPGPLPVMVAASIGGGGSDGGGGRLVVIGDADFASNGYLDLLGNRDLFLNSVSWLTDEEALIARRPKEIAEIARPLSPLVVTERQAHMLFLLTVVVQPGLVLALGAGIVVMRRRRG